MPEPERGATRTVRRKERFTKTMSEENSVFSGRFSTIGGTFCPRNAAWGAGA
jgi:hypothetical protein